MILSILFYKQIYANHLLIIYFILFSSALPFIFKLTKNLSFDTQLGNLSYPIYISHMFLIVLLSKLPLPTYIEKTLFLAIVCIAFSYVVNNYISNPIEKFRQNRISKN